MKNPEIFVLSFKMFIIIITKLVYLLFAILFHKRNNKLIDFFIPENNETFVEILSNQTPSNITLTMEKGSKQTIGFVIMIMPLSRRGNSHCV
jgi:hypothetical protein